MWARLSLRHSLVLKAVFQLVFDTQLMNDAMVYCDCNIPKWFSLAMPFDVPFQKVRQIPPFPI